jgi:hypothetical protein
MGLPTLAKTTQNPCKPKHSRTADRIQTSQNHAHEISESI